MFARVKQNGPRAYLVVVESRREGRSVKQAVRARLGRVDHLDAKGQAGVVADLNAVLERVRSVTPPRLVSRSLEVKRNYVNGLRVTRPEAPPRTSGFR